MDEVIKRATDSIDIILKSLSSKSYSTSQETAKYEKLKKTSSLLIQASNSLKDTELYRLFYRRLKRLLDYNKSPSAEFWIELHDDISYVLDEPNGIQDEGTTSSWKYFLEKMDVERKMGQHGSPLYRSDSKSNTLRQLLCEYATSFSEYLEKCISLHSKIQVLSLFENNNDLLSRPFPQTEKAENLVEREDIKEKLKSIEISLDCSKTLLDKVDNTFFPSDYTHTTINSSFHNYLPSIKEQEFRKVGSSEIETVLQSNRWSIILGDPGSAKTTLLRWITHVFAKAAHHGDEKVVFEDKIPILVRIPILIRIGEFAEWLEQNQEKGLIDYIGKHTWFLERYCDDKDENILKELIYHGYALILLDGLDEVTDVGQKNKIVDLVKKFINDHVRTLDFLSPFDNIKLDSLNKKIIETQSSIKNGGNQIIITSRIVGYQLYPLNSSFIEHYLVVPFNYVTAKEFVKKWMELVCSEKILLDKKTVKELLEKINKIVDVMFKSNSNLSTPNYSLLALICASVFYSSDEFCPQSRIEVYDHTVQTALHSWREQETSISEDVLTKFLIELATYLHLKSSSGLIDAFGMEQLCCLTLQLQGISNDQETLRNYAKELIRVFDLNIGIVAERGLQVFGFLHLSFQEYFVAQFLVRNSPIDIVVERIFTYIVSLRFRESLILTIGWISWKRSSEDYDTFCKLLVSPNKDFAIPVGALLFFDAINDLRKWPSNSIIFTALDSLLYHSFNAIAKKFFIVNLCKLDKEIITLWMQSHLEDEKCLTKFCQCLMRRIRKGVGVVDVLEGSVPPVICEKLRSLLKESRLAPVFVDQTLRYIMLTEHALNHEINRDLYSCFRSQNISASNIHPLILSVIIAVCGGIHLESRTNFQDHEDLTYPIAFSPKHTYCESSVIIPIIEYFWNTKESHSIKIETLIKDYETSLAKFCITDCSNDIVNTFVALICLQSVTKPSIYQKYVGYQAFSLAIDKLKRNWFYLKDFMCSINRSQHDNRIVHNIKSIINAFSSSIGRLIEQRITFSMACAAAWHKLGIYKASSWLESDFFTENIKQYLGCQGEFSDSSDYRINRMKNIFHPLKTFKEQPFFLLTFVPQSLQSLYYYMIIHPTTSNNIPLLPFIVLLLQCLTAFEDVKRRDKKFSFVDAVSMLKLLIDEYRLDNYALAICTEFKTISLEEYKISIDEEFQRIDHATIDEQSPEAKDLQFFVASISLARLLQAKYYHHQNQNINLLPAESDKVHSAITNIRDPVLRIIASSVVLDMKNSSILNEKQRNDLRLEMIGLFLSLLPNRPLPILTLLFVRLHEERKVFPALFQDIVVVIGEKLNETVIDEQSQHQEAAYLALRQLNNSELSSYLLEFARRTNNLSDLLQFNSSIFFRYFIDTTSFGSSNTILLSSLYLTELAFDAQILKMYTDDDQTRQTSPVQELVQLRNNPSTNEKIITYDMVKPITNYLKIPNNTGVYQIIEAVCKSETITRKDLFDRDLIEGLFKILDFLAANNQPKYFSHILYILVQHAHNHTISSLEVHQRVSQIIQQLSYDDNMDSDNNERSILNSLFKISCIKTECTLPTRKLFTESDINIEFKRQIEDVNKRSDLCLRRKYFLIMIEPILTLSN